MTHWAVRLLVPGVGLTAAFALLFFVGCENNEEEGPPPPPPGAAGTYYGIVDFGAGVGTNTEHSVKLVLHENASSVRGGPTVSGYTEATGDSLSGYISYRDSIYLIEGAVEDDSLSVSWTAATNAWTLQGSYDAHSIQGVATCPIRSDTMELHRWTGGNRNIAERWLGLYSSSECWPPGGTLRAYLSQSDTLISGRLVVSGAYEMGDTLTIGEGLFFDPILELTAIDSGVDPPSELHLMGMLTSADSMAGTYDWWWDRCLDEGLWNVVRSEPDTGQALADILGVVYHQEEASGTMSAAYIHWEHQGVPITGATASVNGMSLIDYGGGFYALMTGQITVVPGEDYVFNISHPDYGGTTGTARVPGEFTVTSPHQGVVIPRGQSLQVSFTQAQYATFYDAWFQVNDAFEVAIAPATSLVLPGTQIQTPGPDVLEVEAICGDFQQWEATYTGFYGVHGKAINVTVQ
jgi:hypothetical protein